MKKIFIGIGVLVMIAMVLTVTSSKEGASEANALIVGTHSGYAPYESIDGQGNLVGFDIDFAKALATFLGKKLKIVQAQFDSLILGLNKGKYDVVIAGMSITANRLKEISMIPYHGERVAELALVFWKHIPEELNCLANIAASDRCTIAVQQGTWHEAFLKQVPGITVRSLEMNTDLIMDAKYGKSVAVLFEKRVATFLKQKVSELQIVPIALPKAYDVLGVGVGVHKENTALAQQIEEAIFQLKKEGTLAELEKKWFGGQ